MAATIDIWDVVRSLRWMFRDSTWATVSSGSTSTASEVRDVPVGRGGRAASAVSGSAGSYRQVMSGAWLRERLFSRQGGGASWGAVFPLRGLKKSVAGRNDDQDGQEEWFTTGIVSTVGNTVD